MFCAKELDIKITSCQLPNKSDYRDSMLVSHVVGRLLIKYYFKLLLLVKIPVLLRKTLVSDVYMHETTNQRRSTFLLHYGYRLLGKKIYTYPHGHSLNQTTINSKKVYQSEESTFLLFHQSGGDWADNIGYTNQYVIGFPKFYEEWINLVKQFDGSEFKGREIVVIYSRPVSEAYMDYDKYEKLLLSSCKIIRKKLNNIPIIIKPHPREDIVLIESILKHENISNVFISRENSMVLAANAKFIISYWGGSILDGLAMGVPSIEYYIEARHFREHEPEGSVYKKIGLHSVDNESGVEKLIDSVIKGEHQIPKCFGEISKGKNVDFLKMRVDNEE
jgi:hypothetical protein